MPKSAFSGIELPRRERHTKGPSSFSNLWLYCITIGLALYKGCIAAPSNENPQEQTTIAQGQAQLSTRHAAASVLNQTKPSSREPLHHAPKQTISHHTRRSARLILR